MSPALQAYTHVPVIIRRPLLTVPDASALAQITRTPDAADHLVVGDTFHVQFVSEPLAAQTFTSGDAFKYAIQCTESHSGNNLFVRVWMGIYTGDGTTLQSEIRGKINDDLEMVAALTNRFNSNLLSTTYACNPGERLVIEFSQGGTPTAAGGVQGHNGSFNWGCAASSGDLPENDTETGTTFRAWLEFANTVTFAGAIPPVGARKHILMR